MARNVPGLSRSGTEQSETFVNQESPVVAETSCLSHSDFDKQYHDNLELCHKVDVGTAFRTRALANDGKQNRHIIRARTSKYLALHDQAGHIHDKKLNRFMRQFSN